MSRSNQTDITNPAHHFIEWKGEKGKFQYYDKQLESNIEVPLPFKFLVLDTLSTIKGYSDADQSGFWSNEVRDIKNDILTVRTKKGQCAKGIYETVIKDHNCNGARYCQSVYIAYYVEKEMIIANIQIMGAALSAWIDFRKKNNVYNGAIQVKESVQKKKGTTEYFVPVFDMIETSTESDTIAKDLDKELQGYLKLYFGKVEQPASEDIPENEAPQLTEADMPPLDNENDPF